MHLFKLVCSTISQRDKSETDIEVYKRGEWYLLNNVSKKCQLFTKWRVSVNPESSPTDPPPVCFKNEFSCSILHPEKSKILLWNSTARVQGEKLCANFVEFVLKTEIKTFFSLYLSYHFFLRLNICIKFCDDLHSVIDDFQTLYLVIMIESFLEKKRGPDLGNKTSSRFLKLNTYNTVKIKRNMKLLFYRRW